MSNREFIPYGKQTIDDEDIQAVVETLKSNWLTQGPKITEFEKAVAQKVGATYAVAVSNGTAALHCACMAAGVGTGDEIITAPITFAASGNCALFQGAAVKLCDIKSDTYCMDASKLETLITEKTKVIIPVDFTGQPCDMDEINAIAKKHNIYVIEDAAHAIGATYKTRTVGSLADMTIFSFHPVKHVAMGEGGMIVTNNEELYKKLLLARTHGITNADDQMILKEQAFDNENVFNKGKRFETRAPWYYEMQQVGYNYRITDIQCALGVTQLKKLNGFNKLRRSIVSKYNEAFGASDLLTIPYQESDRENAWHLYMLRINLDKTKKTRREIFEELRGFKIGVHVHYIPLHFLPYYQSQFNYKRGDLPEAEKYYDTALTIPLFPSMTEDQINYVITSVLEVVK
jgi:perosamine synthetase